MVQLYSNSGSHNNALLKRICCGDYPYRIWFDANNSNDIECCEHEDVDISEAYGFPGNIIAVGINAVKIELLVGRRYVSCLLHASLYFSYF